MSTSERFPVPGEDTPEGRDLRPRLFTTRTQFCYCADCIRCGCALWEMHHPTLALPLVQEPTPYRLLTAPRGQARPDPIRPIRWRVVLAWCLVGYLLFYGSLRVLAELVGMPWIVRVPLVCMVAWFVGTVIGRRWPARWVLRRSRWTLRRWGR